LLMIYDEEPTANNFFKKIINIKLAEVTLGTNQIKVTESGVDIAVTMLFRDPSHCSEWT